MSKQRKIGQVRATYAFIGETCSKHRVARLMRANNLHARHGYRRTRWSVGKPAVLIPNLLQRRLTVARPNTT